MPRHNPPSFPSVASGLFLACLALVVAGCGEVKQGLDQADASLQQVFGTARKAEPSERALMPVVTPLPKPAATAPDPLRWAEADWDAGRFGAAVSRLRPLAETGNARAQYRLGLAYAQGRGVEKAPVQALAWWHRAAVQGNADAQYQLGLAYLEGDGVEKDAGLASAWLARASARDHGPATYRLARFYEARAAQSANEADRQAGIVLLERAAEQGQPEAQERIGEVYADGRAGMARDAAWAARWFGKAARQGSAEARFRLAEAFAAGQGVPRDMVQAAAWYRLAADGGKADAVEAARTVEASLDDEQKQRVGRLMRRLAAQPAAGNGDVPTVVYVQTALADGGQDVGPADGVMGASTRRALIAWQKARGLDPDGIIGPRVLSTLRGNAGGMLEARMPE